MSKYKDTLNLPSTAFPMKANLANREPEILKYWEQTDLYSKLRELGQGRPRFVLHDGLPTPTATFTSVTRSTRYSRILSSRAKP